MIGTTYFYLLYLFFSSRPRNSPKPPKLSSAPEARNLLCSRNGEQGALRSIFFRIIRFLFFLLCSRNNTLKIVAYIGKYSLKGKTRSASTSVSRAEEDDEGREGRNDAAWGADDYDGAPGCRNDDDDNGDCRPPSTWNPHILRCCRR